MNILHPADAEVINGPANMPECQPLPIVRTADAMVSFWQPNAYELEALQRGGSIFLRIPGRVHPVVALGVDEYPATLATEPYDEALESAVERIGAHTQPERDYFKAGARWQAARPMEMKFVPLDWKVQGDVHFAEDPATEKVLIVSDHDGVIFYGPHAVSGFESGKTLDETKADLQARRDEHLSKLVTFGLSS